MGRLLGRSVVAGAGGALGALGGALVITVLAAVTDDLLKRYGYR